MCVIHWGDLQQILMEGAKAAGAVIRVNFKIARVDPDLEARAQSESGEWIEGDVLVAADGVKSKIRGQILESHGIQDMSLHSGDSAYRLLVPKERIRVDDVESLKLINQRVGVR